MGKILEETRKNQGISAASRGSQWISYPGLDSMKKTVEALEEGGRDQVKVTIGGKRIDDEVRGYVRADAYGKDAVAAVNLCRQWIGG